VTEYALGRRVEHDERSRQFAYRRDVELKSVQHSAFVVPFDQGSLGSCTGEAAVGCLSYKPYYLSMCNLNVPITHELAVRVYSEATAIDEFDGEYPPTDTGSSGLAVAKVLKARGYISGYLHAFSFLDVLGALMKAPLIVGTNWHSDMFSPTQGVVVPTGRIVGGHEYVLDGYGVGSKLLSFRNSWGIRWGIGGKFYMDIDDFQRLLAEDGDATIFVPIEEPAPVPTPPTPQPQGCATFWR